MKRQTEIAVRCGKPSDSMETLEKLCHKEAEKISATLDMKNENEISVPFWTANLRSELICVGIFQKDINGIIRYTLDFSESTL